MSASLKLTIIFDNPFYKAVFEKNDNYGYSVAQINLGTSEPKTIDIYRLVLNNWKIINFSQTQTVTYKKKLNSLSIKKIQKKARQNKKKKKTFHGTKAQQVLQKQHTELKKKKKVNKTKQKQELKQEKYILKQQKKKQKHKGH